MSESSGDDLALFRQAMADVRELRNDRLALRPHASGDRLHASGWPTSSRCCASC
jgi:DNA-nicking Smr family endonuclease